MPDDLARTINDVVIRRLAGDESYQRGLDYFSHGHVELLEDRGGTVRAVVRGSQDYTVTLSADDGVLDYSCDCRSGSDGVFCKHCVAAALARLNGAAKPSGHSKAEKVTLADVGKVLQAEDKDMLVGMVLDWAKDDERLRGRLILYAARRSGPDTGGAAVRRAFEKAVGVRGFVPYREAKAWARSVDDAIDVIEQLLNDGQAAAVVELCESALKSLLAGIQAVDDSDGHFAMLRDRLQGIHYHAWEEARPDPVELARRLFQWELHSDFDVFYGAVVRYTKILGIEGMQVYRELAEAEWKKVPVRPANERFEWGKHVRITQIMKSLAEAAGDTDQLVKVMSRDLSSAYNYWQIAEVYRKAGEHDRALAWGERGIKAFPNHTDSRLREFAAEEYHRRHRDEDGMNLIWAEFSERPYLESYRTLERHAKKAGSWPGWRERALSEIRGRIEKAKENRRGHDHSALVEIFFYERNAEDAWHEAHCWWMLR